MNLKLRNRLSQGQSTTLFPANLFSEPWAWKWSTLRHPLLWLGVIPTGDTEVQPNKHQKNPNHTVNRDFLGSDINFAKIRGEESYTVGNEGTDSKI